MVDILLTNEGDLKYKNNDLVIGFSDNQNILDILQSVKGDYKRSPQIGLNAVSFTNATATSTTIRNQAKLQLELDGFRVKDILVTRNSDGTTNIDPHAER